MLPAALRKYVPAAKRKPKIAADDAIKAVGGNLQYHELEGVGHDSWTPAYRDPDGLLKWLFEQRRSARPHPRA